MCIRDRYAPHLEKCFGLGRNASRATRKAAVAARSGIADDFEMGSDEDSGNEFEPSKKSRPLQTPDSISPAATVSPSVVPSPATARTMSPALLEDLRCFSPTL
eukprot:TRINITY_DN13080_c0_g1_i2.p2 TRINITY_DN13080_c0_g1~~TRINITY_DN13080_c0_g1_i2.p2  ORF type:complete len:103 (-),score=17.23 TRINITY_DN13080_c0_g1_i2:125-433(-)